MASDVAPVLSVRCPADLIGVVPYLLGFHPDDSLVVVAQRGSRIVFAVRYDLPARADGAAPAEARHVAGVVHRQGVDTATVLGYGPPGRVTACVPLLAAALRSAGLTVLDELRITDGRFFSYLCKEPACCPPEGTACPPGNSVVAAAATFAGQVALPDRATLAAQLAPVDGAARAAMRSATRQADERLIRLLSSAAATQQSGERALRRSGETAVRAALHRHRRGDRLTDDEVAWLGVVLTRTPVRDVAWELITDDGGQLGLWTDVLRRVEPGFEPAPACLLAFAAWRCGHGALASVALQRALEQDPDYSMAVLLDEVLRHGLPPATVADPPRPRPRRPVRRDRRRRDLRW